ncbi:hypothetical protein ACIOEX_23340 [Streptomyces sp. NPDC087850]
MVRVAVVMPCFVQVGDGERVRSPEVSEPEFKACAVRPETVRP